LFIDGYTDSGAVGPPFLNPPPGDDIDGTLTVSVSTLFATGIMVPSSTIFTVTQPTVAIGAVTGS
jgi:hypothetical protein